VGKQGATNSNHIHLPLTDNPIGIFLRYRAEIKHCNYGTKLDELTKTLGEQIIPSHDGMMDICLRKV